MTGYTFGPEHTLFRRQGTWIMTDMIVQKDEREADEIEDEGGRVKLYFGGGYGSRVGPRTAEELKAAGFGKWLRIENLPDVVSGERVLIGPERGINTLGHEIDQLTILVTDLTQRIEALEGRTPERETDAYEPAL